MTKHLQLVLVITLALISSIHLTAQTTQKLAGLKASVTVRRDARGIPYIEAENDDDLYFAQGYITASDRLWQMDLLRRTARGELAEIFGDAALAEDKRRRLYGFADLADGMAIRAAQPLRAAVAAYARGVNAYIATLDEKTLPVEFRILRYKPRPWQPSDCFIIGKNFAEFLSTTWQTDLARAALDDLAPEKVARLFPDDSPLDVLVVGNDRKNSSPRGKQRGRRSITPAPVSPINHTATSTGPTKLETLRALAAIAAATQRSAERIGLDAPSLAAASNNWVVGGQHTSSGKPLLANDPHLSASAPSIWYLISLRSPSLHVAGVSAPGSPGIVIGHNERIAWGVTNLGPDVQDLYREKFDPRNPLRYLTPTGWREATVRHETIKVRKSFADATTKDVSLDVTVTRHGPIIYEEKDARYALRWTALDSSALEFAAFYGINRARDWREFCAALADYPGPTQNFVYADTAGHIGYYGAGHIPIRRSGDGSAPVDGATDRGEWRDYIPFARLPHSYDPPSGIIVTANSRVAGRDYPYYLTKRWAAPYRARRIYDLLQAKAKLTREDYRAIQGDVYSISGALFARETLNLARADKNGEASTDASTEAASWRETLRLLEEWDGRLSADSRAALLVGEMREAFRAHIMAAQIGAERERELRYLRRSNDTFIDEVLMKKDGQWLPREYADYPALLRACHSEARAAIAKRLGTTDESKWTWGADNQVRFPHPLARAPLIGAQFVIQPFPQKGSGGSLATVNVGANVSMRLIADPADWDRTQHGIALGESGAPRSTHWTDQLDDWKEARPQELPFSDGAVKKAAVETLILQPAL